MCWNLLLWGCYFSLLYYTVFKYTVESIIVRLAFICQPLSCLTSSLIARFVLPLKLPGKSEASLYSDVLSISVVPKPFSQWTDWKYSVWTVSGQSVAYICTLSLALGKQQGDAVLGGRLFSASLGVTAPSFVAWYDFRTVKVSVLLHEVTLTFSWWELL